MILIDTSVLSLAYRRRIKTSPEPPLVQTFRRLVEEDQPIAIPGIVLQELLSGVRTPSEFERLPSKRNCSPAMRTLNGWRRTVA
jgi:predicted nucleic acid-binding protein